MSESGRLQGGQLVGIDGFFVAFEQFALIGNFFGNDFARQVELSLSVADNFSLTKCPTILPRPSI